MKRIIYGVALLLAGLTTNVQAQELTVATYNVRYKNDSDSIEGHLWSRRCRALCKLIEWERPDLFGTQECLNIQVRDIAGYLKDYEWIGVGRNNGKTSGEYAALFYRPDRVELLDQGTFWLSETPDTPSKGWDAAMNRICTWGRFRDRRTRKIFFMFNLHMDHQGEIARRHSAKLLLEYICKKTHNGQYLAISTADYNLNQTSDIYKLMESSGQVKDCYTNARILFAENGTTTGHFNPDSYTANRIDHIFVTQSAEVESCGILTSLCWQHEHGETNVPRCMSDHYPVFARIRFGATVPSSEMEDALHIGDAVARQLCIDNFDSDGDGVLTYTEVAAVTSIGSVFAGSAMVTFPELAFFTGLTDLPPQAFAGCTKLSRVTLPESLTSIGDEAFKDCRKLTTLFMPDAVTTTGQALFDGCTNLTTVHVPSGCLALYASSFPWNNKGKLVETKYTTTLPKDDVRGVLQTLIDLAVAKSIKVDRERAALDNSESSNALLIAAQKSLREKLRLIHFDDKAARDYALLKWDDDVDDELSYEEAAAVTDLGTMFQGTTTVTADLQPFSAVTTLATGAFQRCTKLTDVKLPAKLTAINNEAFYGCTKLTAVTLPATITNIGSSAFNGCKALTEVTCLNPDPATITLGTTVFNNVPVSTATLYVPAGSEELYREAMVWKTFGQIKSIDGKDDMASRLSALITLANQRGVDAAAERAVSEDAASTPQQIREAVASLSHKLEVISFEADEARQLCLAQWDTDFDGELTYTEAAAVTDISTTFQNSSITTFNELRFFEGLTEISPLAFRRCSSLLSIHLPATVTTIGSYAFLSCAKLRYVVLPNETQMMSNPVLTSLSNKVTFFVPEVLLDSYRNDEQWGQYTTTPYTGMPIVTADDQERMPGEANPELTFTVTGAPVNGTPELVCAADASSPLGDYPITLSAGTITTPNVTYLDGMLHVVSTVKVEGIEARERDKRAGEWYDLSGRIVHPLHQPLQRGVYIVNHQKKLLVK